MPEWSFNRRVISGLALVCLLSALGSAVSLFVARGLVARMVKVETGEGEDLAAARTLQLVGIHEIADAHAFLLTGGRTPTTGVNLGSLRLREQTAHLRTRITDAEGQTLLDNVAVAAEAHEDAFERARAVLGTHPNAAAAEVYAEAVLARGNQLDEALSLVVTHFEAARLKGIAPGRLAVQNAEALMIGIAILTILLLSALCFVLTIGLSRRYRVQASARNLAERGQTEAKATLTEVETASRLKDEFLATVSHELRNPLAPILTWTQLLRGGTLDADKTRRALEVIERNVTSQAQLIDDLVDVSRVASGKFRLDVRPIDLMPVIRAAAESQRPASDAKHIRLQLVLDERAGLISGDSERLQQVMWNLISNAIKFTPKGGRVQVVLQRSESHVEITVSDSGVGIDADFLPHIFEPFRQATGGSMRRHGGLGLGLSIVRHIVELHGGEITAFSAGPSQGSKFTVQFPLLATAPGNQEPLRRHPSAGDSISEVALGRLDDIRVLVVEDEPTASEALMVLFDSCGAVTRVAGSAAEALIELERWKPEVLVSDIAMPGEDGYSLIHRIRALSPENGGLIPAVALTAYAKIDDRVTILAAGFHMYLSKPADPNELVAVVKSLARRGALSKPVGTD